MICVPEWLAAPVIFLLIVLSYVFLADRIFPVSGSATAKMLRIHRREVEEYLLNNRLLDQGVSVVPMCPPNRIEPPECWYCRGEEYP